jgi:hypothetical protein
MHMRLPLFALLLALFLFFRYIRAGRSIPMLLANFIFLGISIYEAKYNITFTIIVVSLVVLQIYIVLLMYKKDPRIVQFQASYKPSETMLHYIVFAVLISILYFVTGLIR